MKLKDRALYNTGVSIVSDKKMQEFLLYGEVPANTFVRESDDTIKFKWKYNEDISGSSADVDITPHIDVNPNEELLIEYLFNNPRDETDDELHIARLEEELTFFLESDNIKFLLSLVELIKHFKENNVIWGIGRGSSCASYVLFLLEIHDINPIAYDIDFKEFSKQA